MKRYTHYTYTAGLLLLLWLVGIQSSQAQFAQYPESSLSPDPELTEEEICRCGPIIFDEDDLNWVEETFEKLFKNKKRKERQRAALMAAQNTLKNTIGEMFGQSFENYEEARGHLHTQYALNRISNTPEAFRAEIQQHSANFDDTADDLAALEHRENEIRRGNINDAYLGSYRIDGRPLSGFKSLADIASVKPGLQEKYDGLDSFLNNNGQSNLVEATRNPEAFRKAMVEDMRFSIWANSTLRTVRVGSQIPEISVTRDYIMAYGAVTTCNFDPIACHQVYANLVNEGRVVAPREGDGLRTARTTGKGKPGYTPKTRSIESLRNDGVITQLGDKTSSYLDTHREIRTAVTHYFDHYDYNKASTDCVNYLFQNVLGPGDFAPNQSDYVSATTPKGRSASHPNRLLESCWSQKSIDLGYQGFQNILHEVNDIPQNYGSIGHIIDDTFKANNIRIPAVESDDFLGRHLTFKKVAVNSTKMEVEFKRNVGQAAWNEGITTVEPIFAHLRRMDGIVGRYGLDGQQRDLLAVGFSFVENLFDFLQDNANGNQKAVDDFAEQAIQDFMEGKETDFEEFEESRIRVNSIRTTEDTDTKVNFILPNCDGATPADVFLEVTNTKRRGKTVIRDISIKVTLTVVNLGRANLSNTIFEKQTGTVRLPNFEGQAQSSDQPTGNKTEDVIKSFEVDYKVVNSLESIGKNDHVMLIVSEIPKIKDEKLEPVGRAVLGGRISAVERGTISRFTFNEIALHELAHNLSLMHTKLPDLMNEVVNGSTVLSIKKKGDIVNNFLSHSQENGDYKDSISGATYDCNKLPQFRKNIKTRVENFIKDNNITR